MLLLGFHNVIGAFAGYTVETCVQLSKNLTSRPEAATAMYDYPSIPCSPYPLVRLAIPIISVVLIGWARFPRSRELEPGDALIPVLLIAVHGALVSYLWKHPSGPISAVTLKGSSD